MKKLMFALMLAAGCTAATAAPLRVAVLDFEDATGMKSDERLGGDIAPGAMAEKGVYILGKLLAANDGFVLIDRRDLLDQMDQLRYQDLGTNTPTRPSFLHAAQVLRADVVLRGTILSLSTSKQLVNQGGYKADNSILTLRVSLEALDATDGSILATQDGVAKEVARQTEALQTVLSEDDILQMMEHAVAQAIPDLEEALVARSEKLAARPTVKVSFKTDADPAMIEIDGIMVGTTPLATHEVYAGDHVVAISRPGYQPITKRILFEKDSSVEVPMLRQELTADEIKSVLDKASVDVISGIQPNWVIKTLD
jgi:hypothetical protein